MAYFNSIKSVAFIFNILFLFYSCAGASIKKPVLEIGIIDYPRNEIITNMTNGSSIKTAKDLKYKVMAESITFDGVRKSLSTYDNAVCFTPMNWEKLQNYLNELEQANKPKAVTQ